MQEPLNSAPTPPGRRHADRIYRTLERIRRRVFAARLLRTVALDLLVALGLYCVVLAVDRVLALGVHEFTALAVLTGAAVLVSVLRTVWRQRPDLEAAAVIADERLGLKERLTSVVFLRRSPADRVPDGWFDLVREDGERSLADVSVTDSFPLRFPPLARWLPVPLALAFVIASWLPPLDLIGLEERRQADAAMKREVERQQDEMERQLADLEARALKERSVDLEKLLEELRKVQAVPVQPPEQRGEHAAADPKKEALVELTRREERLAKAAASERYRKLEEGIERLQRTSLKDSTLTRKLRERLKEAKLAEAAKELERLEADLAAMSRRELTAGEKRRLEELAAEVARLSRDAQGLGELSERLAALAGAIGGASETAGGKLDEAVDAARLGREELERLAEMLDEMETLDEALELVRGTKEELAQLTRCPECKGLKSARKPGGT